MEVKSHTKLSSGYWHVRFNMDQFVQWPIGSWPLGKDTFGFFIEDKEQAASLAGKAVSPPEAA